MHVRIHRQKRGRRVLCIVSDLSYKRKKWHRVAFTLIELMIVLAIIGTLMGVGMPLYQNQLERARVMVAISDLKTMQERIKDFLFENGRLPDTLVEVPGAKRLDPWGNPYEYLNIEGGGPGAQGKARLDQFMVPLNTDYDLFSKGKDGDSKRPLMNPESWDDILRANNGAYAGVASEF